MRVERRREIREAQIAFGDREVFVNDQGEKMSRLKVGPAVSQRGENARGARKGGSTQRGKHTLAGHTWWHARPFAWCRPLTLALPAGAL